MEIRQYSLYAFIKLNQQKLTINNNNGASMRWMVSSWWYNYYWRSLCDLAPDIFFTKIPCVLSYENLFVKVHYFGPLFDGAIVDKAVLPGLVRATSVNAGHLLRSQRPYYQSLYPLINSNYRLRLEMVRCPYRGKCSFFLYLAVANLGGWKPKVAHCIHTWEES